MHLTDLLPLITGQGGALVALTWHIYTLRKDVSYYRRALADQTRRADSAEEAGRAILALATGDRAPSAKDRNPG